MAILAGRTRQSWQQFEESEPGNRFQDRYNRRQQGNSGRFDFRRVLSIPSPESWSP